MKKSGFVMSMLLVIAVAIAWGSILPLSARQNPDIAQPVIAVLAIEGGTIDFQREDWNSPQPLHPGVLLGVDDRIFPENATLMVICPDATLVTFAASALGDYQKVDCAPTMQPHLVGPSGERRFIIKGEGDRDIPVLLAPGPGIVSTTLLNVRWTSSRQTQYYELTLLADGQEILARTRFEADQVESGRSAFAQLPISLQQNTAYDLEICAFNTQLSRICTTHRDTPEDSTFYYVPPTSILDLMALWQLPLDSPIGLLGQAILYSQTDTQAPSGAAIAYTNDAIRFLEQLRIEHPTSAQATSPATLLLLAEFYDSIGLGILSEPIYRQIAGLAFPSTELAAESWLGLARVIPGNPTEAYQTALAHYRAFLSADAYRLQRADICEEMGDLCAQLADIP